MITSQKIYMVLEGDIRAFHVKDRSDNVYGLFDLKISWSLCLHTIRTYRIAWYGNWNDWQIDQFPPEIGSGCHMLHGV